MGHFLIFFHFWVRKFRQDERIPNMVLKFKSDNIWPRFGKKRSKSGKFGYFAGFDRFRQFFFAKQGANVIRFQFLDHFWILLIQEKLSDPKIKENWKLYFLAPTVFSKFQLFCAILTPHRSSSNFIYSVLVPLGNFWNINNLHSPKKAFSLHPSA